MSNYYELLNVDARATTYDIKKAFRQRAKELHPDVNPTGGPELRQQFAELAEAYEVRRKAQHVDSRSAMTLLRIILRAMLRSCKVGPTCIDMQIWRQPHSPACMNASLSARTLQVLRDTSRRAQYDAARNASSFSGSSAWGFPGGVYQPGVSEDAFEAAFRRWWEKAGAE